MAQARITLAILLTTARLAETPNLGSWGAGLVKTCGELHTNHGCFEADGLTKASLHCPSATAIPRLDAARTSPSLTSQ